MEGRKQGQNVKAGKECMNTEYNQKVLGALAIYHHFRVISPLFLFSSHVYDPEHPPVRGLPILEYYIAPLVSTSHPRC